MTAYTPQTRKHRDKWKRLPTLDELAIKHHTDKSHLHAYTTTVYPQFLDQIRYLPVALLEIGVLRGESLRMWDEYFVHPRAKLHAWDIKPEYAEGIPSRFTFQTVDCFNEAQVKAAVNRLPKLDVVVDDGEHSPQAIKVPFEALWTKLNSGGLYIIEDVRFSRHHGIANMIFPKKARSEVHIYGEVIVVRKI